MRIAEGGEMAKQNIATPVLAMAIGALAILPAPGLASGQLNIYNWGEYINPRILQAFEAEQNVHINLQTYSSNEEMLTKILSGTSGYDLVFPSVHIQDIMFRLGQLEQTDINQYEGFRHIDRNTLRAKTDPDGRYCLPYAFGTVGILYNRRVLGKDISGWKDLLATVKEKQLKFTLLDDMRETLGVGLLLNGHSINTTDLGELREATKTIVAMKPYVAAFTYNSRAMVASGDIAAAHYFVGSMIDVLANPDELGFVIPEEGATLYQENICVLKDAPHKAEALAFLKFYTRPEIAALNVKQQTNGTPNLDAKALVPPEISQNSQIYFTDSTAQRLQIFEDVGVSIRLYDRAWSKVRSAQ